MANGVSVYLGMNHHIDEILDYLKKASSYGFEKVFTSLHIPEANYHQIIPEFKQMVSCANQLNMSVIADISPNAYGYLGLDLHNLSTFVELGLSGVRLDYGFTAIQIAEYSNNSYDLLIEINASTIDELFLQELINNKANINNLSACHNYYPRLNTGINFDSLNKKNSLLHNYGISVSAFAALGYNQRGPFYDGLPTIEETRYLLPVVTCQLLNLNATDHIILGDGFASDRDLEMISQLSISCVLLPCIKFNDNVIYSNLLNSIHTNRPDSASDVIRSQESRLSLLENINLSRSIDPENCIVRKLGDITIDNILYKRYSGELQICKIDLPADERVNVIGAIHYDALSLLDYIGDSGKFKLLKIINS